MPFLLFSDPALFLPWIQKLESLWKGPFLITKMLSPHKAEIKKSRDSADKLKQKAVADAHLKSSYNKSNSTVKQYRSE